ncbi:DUF3696 domain-containing protein [Myxococcus sp. AM009]|uniref:AAA family ATPase n=1 Tax=Myxococcus sp. AM009 TaxID=2745137 RepID=UPI0015960615|nr:DUF3696 domain-containing protein [Myxococcus sp. AM009]NVJ02794.1 DUF3696 domain-containing protein [Myxococcus sp. AM009]
MLKNWTLENFKPIKGRLDLPLRPITVLAGLNSSGKSSVLQSILLFTQTLSNQSTEKSLILNGHVVQLGTFEGIRNERAVQPNIGIGFELSLATPQPEERAPAQGTILWGRRVPRTESVKSINLLATFRSARHFDSDSSGIEAVKVALASARMQLALSPRGIHPEIPQPHQEHKAHTLVADVSPMTAESQRELMSGIGEEFIRALSHPESENYSISISWPENTRPPTTHLTHLSHFLPERFFSRFSLAEEAEAEAEHLVEVLYGEAPPWARRVRHEEVLRKLFDDPISGRLREKIGELTRKTATEGFEGKTASELSGWSLGLPLKTRRKHRFVKSVRAAIAEEIASEIKNRFTSTAQFGLRRVTEDYGVSAIEMASQRTTNFFTTMIRYLGPLRADPRAAQGFAPSNEPDDVGPKGEFAASVYEANRKQRISWWNPTTGSESINTLEKAVDIWAQYLGVAHRVSTRDAGISGVSWAVQHLPNSKDRPLQSVGVGVSQILPILVAGLLAPKGAVILIEQPELHLHARAQARLGDFFVGLARTGKQCIIETHSENLVTQLRYHIANASDGISGDVEIYFANQDRAGESTFSPVKISASGNIENWPDGFFDEGLRQEDKITRAAFLARKNKSKK